VSWMLRYRCRIFLRSSLSAAPIACMALALLAAPLIRMVDERTRWTLMDFGLEGSRVVVGALAASLLTFIVFAFSIILLAVQIAGGQLTPRIIARVFESRLTKLTLSAFVFSYTYTLAALGRIEDRVPQLPVLVAGLSSLISVALFLYLIQKVSQGLRPIMILTRVGNDTRTVISEVYPGLFSMSTGGHPGQDFKTLQAKRTLSHSGHPGVVIAFDTGGLVEIARRSGVTIELVPQVGDFLAFGEDIFHLYGSGTGTVSDGSLRRCIAFGPERSLDKDPAFGLRILVDIAIKALSPAINDPTTAVLAIDQIQHLLRLLSERQLDTGVVRDSSGTVRLVYRTPGWEDFLTLTVTEIRLCGANSPQVTRRLQAMFEQLVQVVPPERAGMLRKELALLKRTIERGFVDPEDRVIAGTSDRQGLGRQESEDRGQKTGVRRQESGVRRQKAEDRRQKTGVGMRTPATRFEDLVVWQKAHQFVLGIYRLSRTFPRSEIYGLSSQFRRVAVSIAANIAEGFKKRSKADKVRFYNISQGSIEESRYFFVLTKDLEYGNVCELSQLLE